MERIEACFPNTPFPIRTQELCAGGEVPSIENVEEIRTVLTQVTFLLLFFNLIAYYTTRVEAYRMTRNALIHSLDKQG